MAALARLGRPTMEPIMKQLTFVDPLELTLREAFRKYHKQPDHSAGHVLQIETALDHWERCTGNPPIGKIDNGVMQEFRTLFFVAPLPSKIDKLIRRCGKLEESALNTLRLLQIEFTALAVLSPADRYAVCAEALSKCMPLPDCVRALLPAPTTFNAVRASLEAVLATLGPKSDGHPFALGLLPYVPRARPAHEEEPEVKIASEDELEAIYLACNVASWPDPRKTGVPAAAIWRALEVYLYNNANRRQDFEKLRKDQVNLDHGTVSFTSKKTKKTRTQPLHPVVIEHFRAIWDSRSELVFALPRNRKSMYATWRKIQRNAGIKVQRPKSSERHDVYGFHELRKTSLGEYFQINERASQMLGAHSSMQTQLRHYIAATKKEGVLRQASDALPQPSAFRVHQDHEPEPPVDDRPRFRVVG